MKKILITGGAGKIGTHFVHNHAKEYDITVVDLNTNHINFPENAREFAERMADDLQKAGVPIWLHDEAESKTRWAGGVHPALAECTRMIYVLAEEATEASIAEAWEFFRQAWLFVGENRNIETRT